MLDVHQLQPCPDLTERTQQWWVAAIIEPVLKLPVSRNVGTYAEMVEEKSQSSYRVATMVGDALG